MPSPVHQPLTNYCSGFASCRSRRHPRKRRRGLFTSRNVVCLTSSLPCHWDSPLGILILSLVIIPRLASQPPPLPVLFPFVLLARDGRQPSTGTIVRNLYLSMPV